MRKFTDAFIDKQIASIDALHDKTREHCPVLPEPNSDCFGIGSWEYKMAREVAAHRYRCGYVDGFWMGWTLRSHATEDEVTS